MYICIYVQCGYVKPNEVETSLYKVPPKLSSEFVPLAKKKKKKNTSLS